jgi:hypothetical protein
MLAMMCKIKIAYKAYGLHFVDNMNGILSLMACFVLKYSTSAALPHKFHHCCKKKTTTYMDH